MKSGSAELWNRVEDRVAAWRVAVERVSETERSVLAFGRRGKQAVVLKVVKSGGEEWRSGEVLDAFDARGVVRVYEYVDGAMLLERLRPGESLVSMSLGAADDEASRILAQTIAAMSPRVPASTVPTVRAWGTGFDRFAASGDRRIPERLVSAARQLYSELCDSQSRVRLLHGDLHHENVLHDDERGWVAIDPKGVLGEPEYELGAALRNPWERPDLFADPAIIQSRVERFARELRLDASRVLSWAFAQAVLAAIWAAEDGVSLQPGHRWIALANAIHPMLKGSIDEA